MNLKPESQHQPMHGESVILLVDDDPLVRESIAAQLEDNGYTITAVGSAEEALSLLRSGTQVDCVVTDLSMPGMDGLTLLSVCSER